MFAVTRLRAHGQDGAALADAVTTLLGGAVRPAGLPGRRTRPVGRRPGPLGPGDPLGRRRLVPPGAVGRRGEDRRRTGVGACARRTGCLRHRLTTARLRSGRGESDRTARYARRRKRRMERVEHDLSPEQWAALQAAWGGCAYCGATGVAAAARLRPADLPRRAVHARQHRAGLRLLQRQQVQRRGHRLAAAQAARRAGLPAPPRRDPDRAWPQRFADVPTQA